MESELPLELASEGEGEEGLHRPVCSRCTRPASVCLCSAMPDSPLETKTHVIVLQHPHEAKQRLATVPILQRCLRHCHVARGRRFKRGSLAVLDMLSETAGQGLNGGSAHIASANTEVGEFLHFRRRPCLLLFPSMRAVDLSLWAKEYRASRIKLLKSGGDDGFMSSKSLLTQQVGSVPKTGKLEAADRMKSRGKDEFGGGHSANEEIYGASQVRSLQSGISHAEEHDAAEGYVLIVLDGTWQHTREMMTASEDFLRRFTQPVCLPFDTTIEGPPMGSRGFIVRKEPCEGFMSTMEAVARALCILEDEGDQIQEQLVRALGRMVELQQTHIASKAQDQSAAS